MERKPTQQKLRLSVKRKDCVIGMIQPEGIAIAWRRVNLVIWGTRLEFWKVWVDQLLFSHFLVFCPLLRHLI